MLWCRLPRLVAAWQAASQAQAAKRQQKAIAEEHHGHQTKRRLLQQWRAAAAALAVEREQVAVAEQHNGRMLKARAWSTWNWYCW